MPKKKLQKTTNNCIVEWFFAFGYESNHKTKKYKPNK